MQVAGGLVAHDPHFYLRNHTLVGVTLGGYPREVMRQMNAETHAHVTRLLDEGRYRPTVTRCVPFADAAGALTDLAARRTTGRVVVEVRA